MKIDSRAIVNSFVFLTWLTLTYSVYHDYVNSNLWRIIIWAALFTVSAGLYFGMKHLSPWTNFVLSLTIIANIFGEIIFEFFYTIPIYDKILHFSIPFIIVFISYYALKLWIKDDDKRLIFSLYVTIGLALIWEVAEVVFDYFFDAPMVGVFVNEVVDERIVNSIELMSPIKDTVYDVILDFLGSFLAFFIIKRNKKNF